MACYHPLKGFAIDTNPSGKPKYFITSNDTDHVEMRNGQWRASNVKTILGKRFVSNYVEIPCGRCIGCRLEYSRVWAMRMMAESMDHDESYFLTLTYDDSALPSAQSITKDGEILTLPTLVKKDVSDFVKALRNRKQKIRFYAAGEYGDEKKRPHYHMICFGLHLDDLVFYRMSDKGNFPLYNSKYLDDIWKKGYVVVGQCSFETCAYTARYILKKQYGKSAGSAYTDLNITAPFSLMSRRPGIGSKFYEENRDRLYEESALYFPTDSGNFRITTNRYYNNLLERDDPEAFCFLKENNKQRAKNRDAVRAALNNDLATLSKYDQLLVDEQVKISQTKILERRKWK